MQHKIIASFTHTQLQKKRKEIKRIKQKEIKTHGGPRHYAPTDGRTALSFRGKTSLELRVKYTFMYVQQQRGRKTVNTSIHICLLRYRSYRAINPIFKACIIMVVPKKASFAIVRVKQPYYRIQ